jgi:hypothetical protein
LVDSSIILESASAAFTAFVAALTAILVLQSVRSDAAARSGLLHLLSRHALAFSNFWDLTLGNRLGKLNHAVRTRNLERLVISLAIVIGLLLAFFLPAFPGGTSLSPLLPAFTLLVGIPTVVALRKLRLHAVKTESRLVSFASKRNPEDWGPLETQTAQAFAALDHEAIQLFLVAYVAVIGAALGYIVNPSGVLQRLDLLFVSAIGITGLTLTVPYVLESQRLAENRLFKAYLRARPDVEVIVDVYYASTGRVCEAGRLTEVGDACVIKNRAGFVVELAWGKIDLIVANTNIAPAAQP